MRGYFDEDETEPKQEKRDREMTLGAGAVIGLVFALLLLCGLCFGVGYVVGHHSSSSSAANGPTPAPDQEPLQGNNGIPKPSAAEQTAPSQPPASDSTTAPDAETPPAGADPTATQPSSGAGAPGATTPVAAQPVRPALPAAGNAPPPAPAAPNVRTALPAPAQFMVQIAAVANSDDADVLVTALRKRSYSVTASREPADGLIHVKIGPCNSRNEANRWRDKLLGDGYNAVVQP